jgi:hypothetical protein
MAIAGSCSASSSATSRRREDELAVAPQDLTPSRLQRTLDRNVGRVDKALGPSLSVEQLVTQHARTVKKLKEEHRKVMLAIQKDYDEQMNKMKKEVVVLRRQLADEIDRNRRLGDLLRNNYSD